MNMIHESGADTRLCDPLETERKSTCDVCVSFDDGKIK